MQLLSPSVQVSTENQRKEALPPALQPAAQPTAQPALHPAGQLFLQLLRSRLYRQADELDEILDGERH